MTLNSLAAIIKVTFLSFLKNFASSKGAAMSYEKVKELQLKYGFGLQIVIYITVEKTQSAPGYEISGKFPKRNMRSAGGFLPLFYDPDAKLIKTQTSWRLD